MRSWAESDRYDIRHAEWPSEKERLQEQAEERDARAEALEKELADVRQRIAELESHRCGRVS